MRLPRRHTRILFIIGIGMSPPRSLPKVASLAISRCFASATSAGRLIPAMRDSAIGHPGCGLFQTRPQGVISSNTSSGFTASPLLTKTPVTLPAMGAWISVSIFIASVTSTD